MVERRGVVSSRGGVLVRVAGPVALVASAAAVRRRHDNPHAERQIEALKLPRWRSRTELAAEQAAAAERERERLELEARQARADELAEQARSARALAVSAARGATTPDGRRLASELAADALGAERVALAAAARVPVPWGELSPAELAFRWMLAHHHDDPWREPSDYSAWACATRIAWKKARGVVDTDGGAPRG